MSNAIQVDGLGKQYRIGLKKRSYRTLRETLVEMAMAPAQRVARLVRRETGSLGEPEGTFWALQDVSFAIKHGEAVGFIGRNGAGKSTLFKILSRITEPTAGIVRIRGRMGSLLEVGTGFHPELTGRENIFLNGALLGMSKADIERRLDEIIAFSEIEKFLETPVKHYSSGMYVRLAFAVAAHLEPDILLVDEVLAVGDAAFQKKCLEKMRQVGREGRTVLFISHNVHIMTRLCQRVVLLDQGRVVVDGLPREVVDTYLMSGVRTTGAREWPDDNAPGDGVARLRAVRVRTADGGVTDRVEDWRPVSVEMQYEVLKGDCLLLPHFNFVTEDGILAFTAMDTDPEWQRRPRPPGSYVSRALIPGNLLAEGKLYVEAAMLALNPTRPIFCQTNAVDFRVIDVPHAGSTRGDWPGKMGGVVRPRLQWTTQFTASEVDASTLAAG